jgi:phosphate acetyltransferase
MEFIENKTYEEIQVGDKASLARTLTPEDIHLFAVMSGDINPAHMDEEYAQSSMFHKIIAHGMWSGSLISTILGVNLPGPGTIYLGQTLRFKRPVTLGDQVTVTVEVKEKDDAKKRIKLHCICVNQNGDLVTEGEADVIAPSEKIKRERVILPEVQMYEKGSRHREMIDKGRAMEPVPTAVAHPCNQVSLIGALEAAQANLIEPILVGPESKIKKVAEENNIDISKFEIVDVEHSHDSAIQAVEIVRSGRAEALMKGSLHTDELMHAVLHKDKGIRTERKMSHVAAMDVPRSPRVIYITDAAINIYPSLEDKLHILQNAIEVVQSMGVETPKIAVLSAMETINTKINSTIEAAALCKMADRGQLKNCVIDGPLAFDNAISREAANIKGITSEVSGEADILLVPDLESGNMLFKQLTYLADASMAGVVMGARVPIILTSRADDTLARMASCALAVMVAAYRKKMKGVK